MPDFNGQIDTFLNFIFIYQRGRTEFKIENAIFTHRKINQSINQSLNQRSFKFKVTNIMNMKQTLIKK